MSGVLPEGEGYLYTRADGMSEWREPPRCKCGGRAMFGFVRPKDEAKPGEVIGNVRCDTCGSVLTEFLQPSQADLDRGVQLAEEFGWQ